jgi:membrane-bound ClpP family serine protease
VSYRETRPLRHAQVSLRHFGWSLFPRLPGALVLPLSPILAGMKTLVLSSLLLAAAPALAQQVATPTAHSSSSTILLVGVALAGLCFFLAVRAAAKKQKRPQQ